jgi:RecB family exonuclease
MKAIGVEMSKRIKNEQLQTLSDQDIPVYSISRLNSIHDCAYAAYKTYIKNERGINNVYGILGSRVHDTVEKIVRDEASEKDLLPALEAEFEDLNILGIDFPKDRSGNDTVKNNWVADMTHFCKNFVKLKGRFTTEEFILYKIHDRCYVQGYIDLIKHYPDGSVSVFDWKTSTDFKSGDLLHHGRQLVFYALALEQMGMKVKETAWIMLKYCEVSFIGKARSNAKSKTEITKVINRGKLVKELQPHIEYQLQELGYEELEIEIMLKKAIDNNSMDVLPKEIQDVYTIKPYVRKYELTDELRQETLDYINQTVDLFESKSDDESDWKPRPFVRVSKTGKETEDVFSCLVTCNHRKSCKYIQRYLEEKDLKKAPEDELF